MIETNVFFASIFFGISIILPVLVSISRPIARRISMACAGLGLLALADISLRVMITNSAMTLNLASFYKELSFELLIDRLSAFFILTIILVSLAVLIYSFRYVEHLKKKHGKNIAVSLMNLFIVSMILVVASKNLISFLFLWELMSISSFFLVYFDYEQKTTGKAGMFYIIMTQLSTLFLIASFLLVYSSGNSFEIRQMPQNAPMASVIFILAFLGFGIKAGVIPFHKWLPYAHPAAPSNISALMSGLMIKVAIYGMIRILLTVLPKPLLWWGVLILLFGTLSAVLGVIYALKEHDIKRLLAYHSIENIGIILIGLGLYVIFKASHFEALAFMAIAGSLFHTLNHALFKSLLFLTSGSVVMATETKNIEDMGGLIKNMPATAFLFLIGAVSISALPPFNGFVSEYMIFYVFFNTHVLISPFLKILLVASACILALTSALAAACFVKAFGTIFLGVPRSKHASSAQEASKSMIIGPAIIAILCALLGIFSFQIFSILGFNFPIPNMMYISIVLAGTYLIFFLLLYRASKIRVYETWSCGFPLSNGKTEYTASGFSEPIVTIFRAIYKPKRNSTKEFYDDSNVIVSHGHAEMSLMKFFEEYLYAPVLKAVDFTSGITARLQAGYLDLYIVYVFLGSLALLIAMGVLT
ncbi:hydrogenase membrane subunit [Candidatus Woesearchaeota archaeon]|nr:hydrogenase membrane subunit [Candidatus Woesearchaeota archaeon]MBI2130492.1 hydrogenase membrane subunit [Candidatus Woesearchaeota archaeon]MBI2661586.1 hydrogenase membrane subunit [Candidatus Woesearchaeota archaeon]